METQTTVREMETYILNEIIHKFSEKASLPAYFAFNTCARVRHQV